MGNQCVIDCLRFIFLDLEALMLILKQNFQISIKHLKDNRFNKKMVFHFRLCYNFSFTYVCKIIL